MPKKKSPLSVMDAAYEAANKRCTEALLAGVDIDDAIRGLEAAYEAANMRYTNALMRRSTRDLPHSANAMPVDEVVTADARFADENEEINCNFVVVAQIVE
tara:strand:- start:2943 stop:3245 length:303 start_codon:yes stop_codon:yes gene_type:complete